MQIIHKVDDFLYKLFEIKDRNKESLVNAIRNYYTLDGQSPDVQENDSIIVVNVDIDGLHINALKYRKMIGLCEERKFEQAYPLVLELIENQPNNSDLHRIKGQIESEGGKYNEAMNSLIEALRWDPNNTYALIMMGNVYMKVFEDTQTATMYYDRAHETDPTDNISLNNIAANLVSNGDTEKARKYFNKALEINTSYPNTHYGLALLELRENNFNVAFNHALNLLKITKRGDEFFNRALSLIKEISDNIESSGIAETALEEYISKLENLTGKGIEIEKDDSIPTVAKVELAENHNRNYHLVKYKPNSLGVHHLIIHELQHIELADEARLAGHNMLFTATKDHRIKFFSDYEKYLHFLQKKGFPETNIANVMGSLFEGLNRQVFNTPIDLFIEDRIFDRFKDLQPVQFVSLYKLLEEGIDAVTRKEIVELSDKKILSKSKIYNLVNALHFNDLFGIDYTKRMKPTVSEMNSAKSMYDEYLEYRNDPEPGEEYELVQNWGNDLNLSKYFELVNEKDYRGHIDALSENLYGYDDGPDADADRELLMHEFKTAHENKGINIAVMMYMVGALDYFENKTPAEIKMTAFEIANLGMNGINPDDKSGYSVRSIPGSNFSGYQMLAYYYVSFALSAPQILPELQLPFDKEYEAAKAFKK